MWKSMNRPDDDDDDEYTTHVAMRFTDSDIDGDDDTFSIIDVKERFLRFLFMSRFYIFNVFYFNNVFYYKKRWSYFYILHNFFHLIL